MAFPLQPEMVAQLCRELAFRWYEGSTCKREFQFYARLSCSVEKAVVLEHEYIGELQRERDEEHLLALSRTQEHELDDELEETNQIKKKIRVFSKINILSDWVVYTPELSDDFLYDSAPQSKTEIWYKKI